MIFWLIAVAFATTIPLSRVSRATGRHAFLGRRETFLEFKARKNNTHAIEYFGSITVGGQEIRVLFDTGSDSLIVPGRDCGSEACKSHRAYDDRSSKNASTPTGDLRAVQFGTGEAAGVDRSDVVCLGKSCGLAEFLETIQESDNPFLHAGFDGVLGLSSAKLRKNATSRSSVLDALVADKSLPAAVFGIALGGEPRIEFGLGPRSWPQLTWVNISEPGYWQISLAGLSVGGHDLGLCSAHMEEGQNITTFFGHMCCRSVEEFEHEERCQYASGGKRSRYAADGNVAKVFDDGSLAVRMTDGCVQRVPRNWVTTDKGCRGDGTLQAIIDSGMSLLMAPPPVASRLLSTLSIPENCTAPHSAYPPIGFRLENGEVLSLSAADYMDTVELADGTFCWPHVMAMPPTAKGSAVILGMPFLRAFATVFDEERRMVGFTRTSAQSVGAVRLHGRRGVEDA
jgi:hypothetical protein